MKTALKKAIVTGAIITLCTSTYAAFLATIMKQGFLTDDFLVNWLSKIPVIYVLLLPFVLMVAPLVRVLVDRMFRNEKK